MANLESSNFLDFTKLTYTDIIQQVTDKLNQDPKFENFRETAISQQMVEIFSSVADFLNYYIERRAEESAGFDTAQLRSSIISLSKQLGYVIQRPIPSESTMSVAINGPITSGSVVAGDTINLEKFNTTFTYNGHPYILKKTYTYTFTEEDISNLQDPEYSKVIDGSYVDDDDLVLDPQGNVPTSAIMPIEIMQGEITSANFVSDGTILQEFFIDDEQFSNLFGDRDFSYDSQTGEYSLPEGITKVGVGTSTIDALDDVNLYEIDRRSLLTSETVLGAQNNDDIIDIPQLCHIRTRLDDKVDVVFGDDRFAVKPSNGKIIVVQYLRTVGKRANEVGVIGRKITSNNPVIASNGFDLTDNVEYRFKTNIKNGADIEDVESIKINAPEIYYSLDRLVSKSDYNSFLRSLTSPFKIENSVVWGEHEEVNSRLVDGEGNQAISELCNIVLWSVIGSMYNKPKNGTYNARQFNGIGELAVEQSLVEGTEYHTPSSEQLILSEFFPNWFSRVHNNLWVRSDNNGVLAQLDFQETLAISSPQHNFTKIDELLRNRQQITTRSLYVSPLVQEFEIDGTVTINRMANLNTVQQKVNNAIYDYLDLQADFNKPLYISNIIDIVESFPEVENSSLRFEAKKSTLHSITGRSYRNNGFVYDVPTSGWEQLPEVNGDFVSDKDLIVDIFESNDDFINNVLFTEKTWSTDDVTRAAGWLHNADYRDRINYTERDFFFTTMKKNYDDLITNGLQTFVNAPEFTSMMFKYNNEYK